VLADAQLVRQCGDGLGGSRRQLAGDGRGVKLLGNRPPAKAAEPATCSAARLRFADL
jgi:hypothetical protein